MDGIKNFAEFKAECKRLTSLLPEYEPNGTCSKCGFAHLTTNYITHAMRGRTLWMGWKCEANLGFDRLERGCPNCGAVRYERPLDALGGDE